MDNPFDKKLISDTAEGAMTIKMPPIQAPPEVRKDIENDIKKDNVKKEIPKTKKARILEEFGGLESNIPVTHTYWKMRW